MKNYSAMKKLQHPIAKPRRVVQKNNQHESWTPIAAVILTSLFGYLVYALCSHIPVVDYCSTGVWQIIG